MAKSRSGCGAILLLFIIIFLIVLIIILQNPKIFNHKYVNNIKNYISKIEGKKSLKELKNLEEKLLKEKGTSTIRKDDNLTVDLYFVEYVQSKDKLKLVKVSRIIPNSETPLTDTIELLLEGPLEKERRQGISSLFPANVNLLSVEVKNNIAYLNFNSELESGVGVSMLQARLYQIIYTATQFPNITGVKILMDNKEKQTFSTEGLSIKHPLKRLKEEPIF